MDGNGDFQPFLLVMIWNHPIEPTIQTWLFRVPSSYGYFLLQHFTAHPAFLMRINGGTEKIHRKDSKPPGFHGADFNTVFCWQFFVVAAVPRRKVPVNSMQQGSSGVFGWICECYEA